MRKRIAKLFGMLLLVSVLFPSMTFAQEVTYQFYPTSGIGYVGLRATSTFFTEASWNTIHNGNYGSIMENYGTWIDINANAGDIFRMFLPFDTSALPLDATITQATIYLKPGNDFNPDYSPGSYIGIVGSTRQRSTTSLMFSDYHKAGSVNGPTIFSNLVALGTEFAPGMSHVPFVLNTQGLNEITRGGITKFGVRLRYDILNAWYGYNHASIFGNYNIADRPYLEVKAKINQPLPTAPSGFVASPSTSSSIELSWIDNANNEDGYKIERSGDGMTFVLVATVSSSTTAYIDDGLASGVVYFYRIRAYNSAGVSVYVNAQSATESALPVSPTDLDAIAVSPAKAMLIWDDNAANENGYQIERSLDNVSFVNFATTSSNVATYTDNSLALNTKYYYRVYAFNDVGVSGYSNSAIPTIERLATPTSFFGVASDSSTIMLAWTDHAGENVEYQVERSVNGLDFQQIATTSPGVTDFTDTGLLPMTTYEYRIRVFTFGATSFYANASVDTLPISPSAPTMLEANSSVNPIGVTTPKLAFDAIFQDASSTALAASYQIQIATSSPNWNNLYWDSGKQSLTPPTSVGARSFQIRPNILFPRDGTSYTWRIKFWDQYGNEGEWSTELASFTMKNNAHPHP